MSRRPENRNLHVGEPVTVTTSWEGRLRKRDHESVNYQVSPVLRVKCRNKDGYSKKTGLLYNFPTGRP